MNVHSNEINLVDDEEILFDEDKTEKASKKRKLAEFIKPDSEQKSVSLEDWHNEVKRLKKTEEPSKMEEEKIMIKLNFDEDKENDVKFESPTKIKDEHKTEFTIIHQTKTSTFPSNEFPEQYISFRELFYEKLLREGPEIKRLESAIFTCFHYDQEIIEPIAKEGVKLLIITESEKPGESLIGKSALGFQNLTIIRHQKNQYTNFVGTLRAKLFILKFPTFIRVVITTGNLTLSDWSVWNNGIWFKDFPQVALSGNVDKKKKREEEFSFGDDFKVTLKMFLSCLIPSAANYSALLGLNLDDYDYSKADIILIPSIPGRFRDKDIEKYGHRKIAGILRKLSPKAFGTKREEYYLTYQANSMGNLCEKFIKELLSSLFPQFINIEELRGEKRYKKELTPTGDELYKRVKVVFPSKRYVEARLKDPDSVACVSLHADCYESNAFPKNIFYQYETLKENKFVEDTFSHQNLFIITDGNQEINDNTYIYFGSHSLSASAWGKYEKDYNQISITNYDLGILIPPEKNSQHRKQNIIENLSFTFPPDKYSDDDLPWLTEVHSIKILEEDQE